MSAGNSGSVLKNFGRIFKDMANKKASHHSKNFRNK